MSSSETTNEAGLHQVVQAFVQKKGTLPILAISFLLSFSMASTVGIVPEFLSDRYARLYHDYEGPPCWTFKQGHAPESCQLGAQDGQNGVAWCSVLFNIFAFVCNPVLGRVSDKRGRRGMLMIGVLVNATPPLVFILTQQIASLNPLWYYLASAMLGMLDCMSIMFAAISDVMPEKYRVSSFAFLVAGYYIGFAFAPSLALVVSHLQVSIIAFALVVLALCITILTFPETLPERNVEQEAEAVQIVTDANNSVTDSLSWICNIISSPCRDIFILNRNRTIRLVALGSLCGSMVFSGDNSLLIYYIENKLGVKDKDIAKMFLLMSVFGILCQTVLIQPLVQCLGQKGLLVTSFVSGAFHNFLYAIAQNKGLVFVAVAFSQLTQTNYPLLSSYASQAASENEQGQVQGALFALKALGAGIGPMVMQYCYLHTKDSMRVSPMFLLGSITYALGAVFVSQIKSDGEEQTATETGDNEEEAIPEVEQALLGTVDEDN